MVDDLKYGEEEVLYGDKAYADDQRKIDAESASMTWRVNRKARRGKSLTVLIVLPTAKVSARRRTLNTPLV